jgi:hypothetical protein
MVIRIGKLLSEFLWHSLIEWQYPLNITSSRFVPDALVGLAMDISNQLQAFWGLYDAIWAAESAVIQWHTDERRRQSVDEAFPPDPSHHGDEMLLKLEHTRDTLTKAIYQPRVPVPPSVTVWTDLLRASLVGRHDRGQQSWRHSDSQPLGKMALGLGSDMEISLKDLLSWINNRSIQIWNSNRELEVVARDFRKTLTTWVQSSTVITTEDHRRHMGEDSSLIYIVDCPALHPIPKKVLCEALSGVDKLGYEVRSVRAFVFLVYQRSWRLPQDEYEVCRV